MRTPASGPTRRAFVRTLAQGGVAALSGAAIAARGAEAFQAGTPAFAEPATILRLDSNENPVGPCPAALDAVRYVLTECGRYPSLARDLPGAIARNLGVGEENVLAGCGSGEILRLAVFAFTSPTRALVTALPTFETPATTARILSHPVHEVPVEASLGLDIAGMEARSLGAGLVFFCNPNNPTGTAHPASVVAEFISRITRSSPETVVLVDEAYHEYAESPGYGSVAHLAVEHPRVVVSRTFSKAHGMAGLRVGYAVARPETLARMAQFRLPFAVNVAGAAAALASIDDGAHIERERARNREALAFTRRALADEGLVVPESHANFVFVDVKRDIRDFSMACREHGVAVGRPFAPFVTHARITIGTLDEMRQAVGVFRKVLASVPVSAPAGAGAAAASVHAARIRV